MTNLCTYDLSCFALNRNTLHIGCTIGSITLQLVWSSDFLTWYIWVFLMEYVRPNSHAICQRIAERERERTRNKKALSTAHHQNSQRVQNSIYSLRVNVCAYPFVFLLLLFVSLFLAWRISSFGLKCEFACVRAFFLCSDVLFYTP